MGRQAAGEALSVDISGRVWVVSWHQYRVRTVLLAVFHAWLVARDGHQWQVVGIPCLQGVGWGAVPLLW